MKYSAWSRLEEIKDLLIGNEVRIKDLVIWCGGRYIGVRPPDSGTIAPSQKRSTPGAHVVEEFLVVG